MLWCILFPLFALIHCFDDIEFEKGEAYKVHTYFQRRYEDGRLVDRTSLKYDNHIKTPLLQEISSSDTGASLKVTPNPVENGGRITVIWQDIKSPSRYDFVAFYCPYDDNPKHYLDFFHVTVSATWKNGYGTHHVYVYNMRSQCIFKYYRTTNDQSQVVAVTQKLDFVGGPKDPLQAHLALTNNADEMRIMWNSKKVDSQPMVKYGLTKLLNLVEFQFDVSTYKAHDMCDGPANSTGFWNPGYTYDVILKGLKPNTKYFYSYGSEGHMSAIRNFTTQIPAGDNTPYKFIVYGDMGVDEAYPQASNTKENIMDELRYNDIRVIFHNGDLSYARGYAYIWDQWLSLIQDYATKVPYMVGIGNHEYEHVTGGEKDPSRAEGEGGYRPGWFNGDNDSGGECGVPTNKRFHMPDNGNSLWWYSFDYGLVHYIMISTEHDFSPGSPMYDWLEKDLQNVKRDITPWVIIAGHRPMYTSSSIAADYVVAVNMQRLFEDLLYKYKVDIAFWAHYHLYERTCKLYKDKCREDGIVHIIVGSAGAYLDPEGWFKKDWSLYRNIDYGYGRVTVANSTHLHYEWINNRLNKVMDSVWLIK